MGWKFENFWNAYQYDDLSLITQFSQDHIILPGLRFGFIAALGLAGMVLAGVKYRRARWVVAAVLLHMAALMPVFITERYRLASVPGLCLLAAVFIVDLWKFLREKKWVPTMGLCALSTVAALFVSIPQMDTNLWWLDYYNTGIKATDAGELNKALSSLEIAFAYAPTNAATNFALGNLWLAKGDSRQAKYFYQRTLQADPTHAKAWNNLGVLALTEKRWSLADKFFARSLASVPEDAKTHFLAARTKRELGDLPGAERELKSAMALTPDEKSFKVLEIELRKAVQKPAL
jgi:tetratricopeptide (TPR) repeat protein